MQQKRAKNIRCVFFVVIMMIIMIMFMIMIILK